jgi:hypothetical protein
VHYRSPHVFSLAGRCRLLHTDHHRVRVTRDTLTMFSLTRTGLSPALAPLSSGLPLRYNMVFEGPTTPQDLRPRGLGSSPFARHYSGNTYWYLFLRVLRCFTSPGSPPFRDTLMNRVGFPIRASWDHSLLAAPPSLSQLATPFIAMRCQGIPRTPLLL